MLAQAEKFGAVAVEQFGSRKHLSAVDQSLNKALSFDIWRQNRQPGALCSNDAKSCYDRIVHNIASLCMQWVRVPLAPIQSMFQTIQNLRHYIRTVYGDSSISFSGKEWDTPIQGVGQGNGAGPQIWALISTPIFNFLREKQCGAVFQAPISGKSLFLAGYGFVNDTDLAAAFPSISNAKQAGQQLQKSVDCWEVGIRVTGGALESAKSLWYPVDFKWIKGEPVYKTIQECDVDPIMMRDANGDVGALQCLEPWQAERTLGVRLSPNGCMQTQFKHMESQAIDWVWKLQANHLPQALTRQAWLTTITKTLEYLLPVTTLTKKQCARLSSILISGILPKSGVVRSFPRSLVHGPKSFFGLEIPDFFIIQGVSHITRLVRFSRASIHPTAALIRTSAESMKVLLGCNGNLFQLPWESLNHLAPEGRIKSTWEFCQLYKIEITDDLPQFRPWRERDVLLIPLFLLLGYSGKALHQLNMCRLFCKVTWLSKAATGDGKRLIPFVTQGSWKSDFSDIIYPNQGPPPKEAWVLWGRRWVVVSSFRGQAVSPQGHTSFQRVNFTRSRTSHAIFGIGHPVDQLPPNANPAMAHARGDRWIMTGFSPIVSYPTQSADNFLAFVKLQYKPSDLWVFTNLDMIGDWNTWPDDQQFSLRAVSDGSYKDNHGTAAFIIVANQHLSIRGKVITPGSPSDQNAYRSELAGLYSIAFVVQELCAFFSLPCGHIEVACDGLSALRQVQYRSDTIDTSRPHFDLIMATRFIVSQSQWQWSWRHVLGHQDDLDRTLTQWEKWNVEMDANAKHHWESTYLQERQNTSIWGEPWQTKVEGEYIVSGLYSRLISFCTGTTAREYWRKKRPELDNVDWHAIGGAISTLKWNRRIWITKQVTGFSATGVNMVFMSKLPRAGDRRTHLEVPE